MRLSGTRPLWLAAAHAGNAAITTNRRGDCSTRWPEVSDALRGGLRSHAVIGLRPASAGQKAQRGHKDVCAAGWGSRPSEEGPEQAAVRSSAAWTRRCPWTWQVVISGCRVGLSLVCSSKKRASRWHAQRDARSHPEMTVSPKQNFIASR